MGGGISFCLKELRTMYDLQHEINQVIRRMCLLFTLCLLLACMLLLSGCRTRITAADRAEPSPLPASEGSERAVSDSTFSN